jgi:tRNA (mo5U34)-methyltransferase
MAALGGDEQRPAAAGESSIDAARLRREIEAHEWYHTLELAPGTFTPGWFDLREIPSRIGFPVSLEGKRCLDVGTFDGFWAFEMERRGAREVIAVDVNDPWRWDWPSDHDRETIEALARRKREGVGFDLAHEALRSSVRRLELSVYDLDPSELGRFDFVYLGSLLLHLKNPVAALERVRSVCDGTFLLCDAIDLPRTLLFRRLPLATLDGRGRPWWWMPNLAGLVRMVESAGFELERPPVRLRMTPGAGYPRTKPDPRLLLRRPGRMQLMYAWRGDPHAAIEATPKSSRLANAASAPQVADDLG